jgi:cytochrome c biogenesis protein CcdA
MTLWTLPVSLAAGVLTVVNPCVLPLVPVVVAGARARDPRGPLALAAGFAATFGIVGGLFAALGLDFGEAPYVRPIAAILILLVGLALLVPAFGLRLEAALAPLQRFGAFLQDRLPQSGLVGQALAGVLLALVWAPCAGPTLAAAFVLAAKAGSLPVAMMSMAVFALGAAGALLALGYGLGKLTGKSRGAALASGAVARAVLGAAFSVVGLLILTGADHWLEALATEHMPSWLLWVASSV